MKKYFLIWMLSSTLHVSYGHLLAAPSSLTAIKNEELKEDVASFTPPPGWNLADPKSVNLPPRVQVMVIGKGASTFPPSMNLSSEPYQGTLKQYLQIVKGINQEKGSEWKDLGQIRTQAGPASLSQVDTKSQWGEVRLMHTILLKNGKIYILTASALKSEFSLYYQDFFNAMRSFRITNNLYDLITDNKRKVELKEEVKKMQNNWNLLLSQKQKDNPSKSIQAIQEEVFNSEPFQTTSWKPFNNSLQNKFGDLGIEWQALMQQSVKEELATNSLVKPQT